MNINDVSTPGKTITAAQPGWSGVTANAENGQGEARQQRPGCC
ncbi:hypothetical protein [Janthinobacterium sp. P210006]|nr:hypothetical protein [Janthinobacterium sp. P210006]